jgi:hypothetical protein
VVERAYGFALVLRGSCREPLNAAFVKRTGRRGLFERSQKRLSSTCAACATVRTDHTATRCAAAVVSRRQPAASRIAVTEV